MDSCCDKPISTLPVFDEFEAGARRICAEHGWRSLEDLQRVSLSLRVRAYHDVTQSLVKAKTRMYLYKMPTLIISNGVVEHHYEWTDEERDALKNLDQAIDAEARRLGLLPATRVTS